MSKLFESCSPKRGAKKTFRSERMLEVPKRRGVKRIYTDLIGGLEHFLSFHILGIIIPTDELTFFRGVGEKPPTRDFTGGTSETPPSCSEVGLSSCRFGCILVIFEWQLQPVV